MRTLLAVLLLPLAVAAQAPRDTSVHIGVQRTLRAAPDRATFFVTSEGTAETATDALARAEAKLAAVTAALRAIGPSVELGAPVTLALGPTHARMYPPPQQRTLTARLAVRVHVRAMSQLARVLAASWEAGAATMSSVVFESAAIDSLRQAEYASAITQARQDAEAIARAMGARVATVGDVTSSHFNAPHQQQIHLPPDGSHGHTATAPEVVANLSIQVRFRIVR